jgi:hypothetical protein
MVGAEFDVEFVFELEPPLQPESKERERIEPSKSREQQRTQVLQGKNKSFPGTTSEGIPMDRQSLAP